MAKHLRYYGEFATIEGHSVRVAIYQESDTAFTPEEVRFPADSPLVIEWGEVEKYDVLCGSSATLKIISPSDRKFVDLYSVKYGDVRLEIFRDGKLYWCGCIDTELYEEPYERLDGYDVTLTFTDLGCLDRIPFDADGFKPIKELLTLAMIKTQCIKMGEYAEFNDDFDESFATQYAETIDWSRMLLSTTYGNNLEVIQNAYVRTDNFYDETGEPMSWKEVVEGILQPLAVRLVQVNGLMMLYDLHSLYSQQTENVYWSSDRQDFAIDKTYNNIKITWSPYAESGNMLPTECWPDTVKVNPEITALDMLDGLNVADQVTRETIATIYSYPLTQPEIGRPDETASVGFTLWTTDRCKEDSITLAPGRKLFKVVPQWDGDNTEGVLVYHRSFLYGGQLLALHGYDSKTHYDNPVGEWGSFPTATLFETKHVTIPPQSAECPLQLKLTMEMLMDVRIDPFESPFGFWKYENKKIWTCSGAMEYLNKFAGLVYIPVRLHFKPVGSDVDYVYTNTHVLDQPFNVVEKKDTNGAWRTRDYNTFLWLAYYNPVDKDRKESTAVCKWVTNRQAINPHGDMLTTLMEKMDDGQYIVYPSIGNGGGEMWIEVMSHGWLMASWDNGFRIGGGDQFLSFAMLKLPELEIVNDNVFDQELQYDDIVYNAEVNPDALEELELDTIMGSYTTGVPTARGCYFAEDGSPISEFTRDGRTGKAEELLCGTLYSQYAERHVRLTGERRIEDNRALIFDEDNQSGKKFISMSESQNLITDTTDSVIVELSDDNYDKID